jgi:hypothetical protein
MVLLSPSPSSARISGPVTIHAPNFGFKLGAVPEQVALREKTPCESRVKQRFSVVAEWVVRRLGDAHIGFFDNWHYCQYAVKSCHLIVGRG